MTKALVSGRSGPPSSIPTADSTDAGTTPLDHVRLEVDFGSRTATIRCASQGLLTREALIKALLTHPFLTAPRKLPPGCEGICVEQLQLTLIANPAFDCYEYTIVAPWR